MLRDDHLTPFYSIFKIGHFIFNLITENCNGIQFLSLSAMVSLLKNTVNFGHNLCYIIILYQHARRLYPISLPSLKYNLIYIYYHAIVTEEELDDKISQIDAAIETLVEEWDEALFANSLSVAKTLTQSGKSVVDS